jgi:hypothetical protein
MPISAVVVHGAAVKHDVMADGHVLADGQRRAHVGVHHGAILHIAVLADVDQLVVATQHGAEPDVGALFQFDLADQHVAVGAIQLFGWVSTRESPDGISYYFPHGSWPRVERVAMDRKIVQDFNVWITSARRLIRLILLSYSTFISSTIMIAVKPQILYSP